MSSINKEILEERIREQAIDFVNLVPEAYNIAVLYLQHKANMKASLSSMNIDIIDGDELEDSCYLFIQQINKKIMP